MLAVRYKLSGHGIVVLSLRWLAEEVPLGTDSETVIEAQHVVWRIDFGLLTDVEQTRHGSQFMRLHCAHLV